MSRARRVVAALAALLVWATVAAACTAYLFLHDERDIVVATHDATVRPSLDRHAVLRTGPVLPDLRLPVEDRVGVEIQLGKTNVDSTDQLLQRYAFIASQPDGQVEKVHAAVRDMLRDAAVRGAVIGLLPLLLWWLVGPARRRDLVGRLASRTGLIAVTVLAVAGLAWWRPWLERETPTVPQDEWLPLADFLTVPVPAGLGDVEVRGGAITYGTRRLIESAISTYDTSKVFYDKAVTTAGELDLHKPSEDETVVLFVSDRHDNIGMDRVARAVADRGGASAVFGGGDDTSTGQPWEAFSIDSFTKTFDDWPRWAVTGNHDHGPFVGEALAEDGWFRPDGTVMEGPAGTTLLGLDDPRSSGLGNWRDESGNAFDDATAALTEAACAEEEPVSTILVHDTDLGRPAVAAGCALLVIGGHTHVAKGPTPIEGEDGEVAGYEFTNGTTGGAAYAIAMGSKPRRPAVVSLLTYRDEKPVGVQVVTLQTDGSWVVEEYAELAAAE